MEIREIDLAFCGNREVIAAYLVEGTGGLVLVETGPGSTLENLRRGLAGWGYKFGDIGDVFVTHIHLDHSGGAWALAEAGATVHVPKRGARHLVDPARLEESARMVYGDRFDELWGEIRAIPEGRVHAIEDGEDVEAGGVRFRCWDSPGHAKHHQIFEIGDMALVGDAAGCRLPGQRHLSLTSAPPQFDPEAWEGTLERMERANYSRIYPTHFGAVDDVADHLARFGNVVRESSAFVRKLVEDGAEDGTIRERYSVFCRERAERDGVGEEDWKRYEGANPCGMCADGIALYWRKRMEEEG